MRARYIILDRASWTSHAGMHVIVETARGVEMGTVMTEPKGVSEEEVIQPLKPVIRIATEAGREDRLRRTAKKRRMPSSICLEKIAKHKLDMKLSRGGIHV